MNIRLLALGAAMGAVGAAHAADTLYGIHWWGHTHGQPVDTAPLSLLDAPTYSAWTLESVLTDSAPWWGPDFFVDLYSKMAEWNVEPITRIDYTWDECVPPAEQQAGWPAKYVAAVNKLRHASRVFVVGNEPNIVTSETSTWPSRQIPPAQYAAVYRSIRAAVHGQAVASPLGPYVVLVAGPSPGGPIPNARWMDGNQYLDQVLANIPASELDGIALHAYGGSAAGFMSELRGELAVVDARGMRDKPVWITEFNRPTADANDEQNSAQYVRDVFAGVHNHNQSPGAHNVVGMTWFVYDADNQAGGGWNQYSIEYWKNNGFPAGDPRDLFTAFQQTVDLRYPAGRWGSNPLYATLTNAGFEDGMTGWSTYGTTDGAQTGPWFAGIRGYEGARFFGAATNGGQKNGGAFQSVQAQPGQLYTASGWVQTYRQGPSLVHCRIGIDPTGGIDSTSPNVGWSSWTSSDGAWKQIWVSRTASASTVTVFIEHRQSANNVWNVNAIDRVQIAKGSSLVSGTVQLGGLNNPSAEKLRVELAGEGGEVVSGVPIGATGAFSIMTACRGAFDMRVRGRRWLSALTPSVVIADSGASGLTYELWTGDLDGDDDVDIDDYDVLATQYGQSGAGLGADLDADGDVDIDDYDLLAGAYGQSGA